jgi:hydroxymethylpyrimidine kinase/phosphomethylpyrimidine kinase
VSAAPVDRPVVLVIGGSDPIGAAGIQADLRHLAVLGVHGAAVPTALTVQRIGSVDLVEPVTPDLLRKSLDAVESTFEPAAVVVGMLATEPLTREVLMWLHKIHVPVVLDPVFKSGSGTPLLDEAGIEVVRDFLTARADLTLPNVDELAALSGIAAADLATEPGRVRALEALIERGAPAVMSKGGHASGDPVVDLLHDGASVTRFASPRLAVAVRGAGGALAAACAARLAHGDALAQAVSSARALLQQALARCQASGSPFIHLGPA